MENSNLFYQIKEIHGPLAGITFTLVILSDLYGASWVLGYQKKLNPKVLDILHKVVFVGLGALIVTGLSMVYMNSQAFTSNMVFWAKMFFVVVLFWNAFRLGKELKLPAEKTFLELTAKEKKQVLTVGVTSIVSWIAALVLAGML